MKSDQLGKGVSLLLVLAGPLVGLFMTPNFSLEPIDQPKMFLLVPLGLGVLFAYLNTLISTRIIREKIFTSVIALFILQLTLVVIFSGAPFGQQFFGTFGRNTGFISYIALCGLALSTSSFNDQEIQRKIVFGLGLTGAASIVYSTLQTLGSDPIKWNNPHNSIIGFLGNPDFASSFLGIIGVLGFVMVIQYRKKFIKSIASGVMTVWAVLLVYLSHALQGLLVFGLGTSLVLYFYIRTQNFPGKKWLSKVYLLIISFSGFLVVLGTLKIGPLSSYLYKISVRQRGFYWHAAVKMMTSHPFFGIGLDSYGDWYLKVRSANAAFHTPETMSNAAHNVFLDLGSSGGWILFLINLVLVTYTFTRGLNGLRKIKEFDWIRVAIFTTWVAYEAQSLVSINQLGLAVWGWILMGLVIGTNPINLPSSRDSGNVVQTRITGRKSKRQKNKNNLGMATTIGVITGLIVVGPYFLADSNMRAASQSRDANKVITAANRYPFDTDRALQAAQSLASSNLIQPSIQIIDRILSINPISYNALRVKYQLTPLSSKEHEKIKDRLQQLNPKIKIQ